MLILQAMTTNERPGEGEPVNEVGGNGAVVEQTSVEESIVEGAPIPTAEEHGPESNEQEHPGSEEAQEAEPEEIVDEAQKEPPVDYQDKYIRLHAEFDNFKKRMSKEKSETLKYAQMPLLRDLTGVMDNLERAVIHAKNNENQDQQAFVAGVDMVTRQIGGIFERYGMVRIEAKGEPFDPTRHEAISVVEDAGIPENTITEEVQTGYFLHDRIVRPAMVMVSKKPAPETEDGDEADGETST